MTEFHIGTRATGSRRQTRWSLLLGLGSIGLLIVGHWATLPTPLVSDEPTHLAQILMLTEHTGQRHPYLTTFETFHWIAARGVELLGSNSPSSVRLVCSMLGFLALIAAYMALRTVHGEPRISAIRAAAILFMPILLPFIFLIYTDALALAAVCLGVWATERKRYLVAATFGILAVAIRQMNIVWLAWLFLVYLVRERSWEHLSKQWTQRIVEIIPYAIGALGFLLFVRLNGGVAIGDPLSHPMGLYDENIFFFLLIALVTLVPLVAARVPETLTMLRKRPRISCVVALIVGLWFVLSWRADHWYNVLPHHVHNEIAMWLNDLGNRIVVAPLLVWTLFSLVELMRPRVDTWLWIGATFLVLLPSYMIEPRYVIVPLAVFGIYRPALPQWQEGAALLWVLLLGIAALTMTSHGLNTI